MAAYRHLGNGIYVGISTDTKPTAASTANGAIAIEWATNYATFTIYVNNQTTWLPQTAFAEVQTNKTFNTTDNTLTATSQAAGDILVNNATKFVRLARGSANQPLKVNSGGTDLDYGTLPIGGGGTGQTTASAAFDALSGLTVAGDIIIGGASGARSKLAIGTANQLLRTNSGATAPEWASTLSGLTLTSPTINGATLATSIIDAGQNTISNLPQHPGLKKTGAWMATGAPNGSNNGTWGTLNCPWTIINSGTNTFTGVSRQAISGINGGSDYRIANGGAGGSQGGFRVTANATVSFAQRNYNPRLDFKLKLFQTTAERVAMGFISSTGTGAPTAGTEPAANLSAVLWWLDTSVDANWHILQNDGSATSDITTIANVAAADTNAHVFSLRADNANSKFQYYYGGSTNGPPNAGSTWVDINTKIPAATTNLTPLFWSENIGATAPVFDWYWIYHEQDV